MTKAPKINIDYPKHKPTTRLMIGGLIVAAIGGITLIYLALLIFG